MQQRIYGLETEYALSLETPNRQLHPVDPGQMFNHLEQELLKRYLTLEANSFGRTPEAQSDGIEVREGHFLECGARFYYDTGHAEWSTAESISPQQAALYELAGERTLAELAQKVIPLKGQGRLLLLKNNVDYEHGTTYGCHENYQIVRRGSQRRDQAFFKKLVEQLIPFLVTRQIFCGAGKVGSADPKVARDVGYQISQRADFIEHETSNDTRSERAIINARDESLADEKRYRRLHLIVGDSNMSPYANILKLGTTGIILTLIQYGALTDLPTLADPIAAIRSVSQDLTCQRPLPLADGRQLSPIEIQQIYLRQAQQFFATVPTDESSSQVLNMWQEVLDDLAIDPMRLADRVDWVIKYHYLLQPQLKKAKTTWQEVAAWSLLINKIRQEESAKGRGARRWRNFYTQHQSFLNQYNLNWNDYKKQRSLYYNLRERDLRYHDIDPTHSLFYTLQRAGAVPNLFSEDEITTAQQHPPKQTRAWLRASIIRWAHKEQRVDDTALDWGRVELTNPRQSILLDDPFATTHPEVTARTTDKDISQANSASDDEELLIRILDVEDIVPEKQGVFDKIKILYDSIFNRN